MELQDRVVVVTGASSGIGRATALALARAGAHVVLAARDAAALEEAAAECRAHGVRALAVPTDVADEAAVEALAARVEAEMGCIDAWVNNAAVYMLGRFEEIPPEAFRRVLDVNLLGYVNGARAALRRFRAQGSGVLVNTASVDSTMGAALATPYVASKFAVRGFTESLRQELRHSGIEVVTVMPPSIDTPLFQHAANFTGRALQPVPPVYPPERVADAIVGAIVRPRREISVAGGRMMRLFRALAPGLSQRLFARQVEKQHFRPEPAAKTEGNLKKPVEPEATHGGWRTGRRIAPIGLTALLVGVPTGAALWARRPRRRLLGR